MTKYHKQLCGKMNPATNSILKASNSKYNGNAIEQMLVLQLFAIAKERNKCPLDINEVEFLAWKKIYYNKMEWQQGFDEEYNEIIQMLDISPYDLQFDFWIFIICVSIMHNNAFGQPPEFYSVWSIISLLNHSCEKNVRSNMSYYLFVTGNAAIPCVARIIFTDRDIKKGEQLFMKYISRDIGKAERR